MKRGRAAADTAAREEQLTLRLSCCDFSSQRTNNSISLPVTSPALPYPRTAITPIASISATIPSTAKFNKLFIELDDRPGICRCGGRWVTLGSSKGPHCGRWKCSACGRFRGWTPAPVFQAIEAFALNWPARPITVTLRKTRNG